MSIISSSFKLLGQGENDCRLTGNKTLTASVTAELRAAVQACSKHGYSAIYLDAKEVIEIDLSGINEIIHAHYNLQQASQKLILEYRKDSSVEKWVRTTGIDKFMATTIVV